MAIRKVRLDAKAEQDLTQVMQATGLNISEVLRRGLFALKREIGRTIATSPYEVYRHLALGTGGMSRAPSTEVRPGVRKALRKKHRR